MAPALGSGLNPLRQSRPAPRDRTPARPRPPQGQKGLDPRPKPGPVYAASPPARGFILEAPRTSGSLLPARRPRQSPTPASTPAASEPSTTCPVHAGHPFFPAGPSTPDVPLSSVRVLSTLENPASASSVYVESLPSRAGPIYPGLLWSPRGCRSTPKPHSVPQGPDYVGVLFASSSLLLRTSSCTPASHVYVGGPLFPSWAPTTRRPYLPSLRDPRLRRNSSLLLRGSEPVQPQGPDIRRLYRGSSTGPSPSTPA